MCVCGRREVVHMLTREMLESWVNRGMLTIGNWEVIFVMPLKDIRRRKLLFVCCLSILYARKGRCLESLREACDRGVFSVKP